jgi:hypothetical protein
MLSVVSNRSPSCPPTLSPQEEEDASLAFILQNFEKLTGCSNSTAYEESEKTLLSKSSTGSTTSEKTLLSKSRTGSMTVEKAKDEDSPQFSLFEKLAALIAYILGKILGDPRIKRMPGDGSCLLHSLIDSLGLNVNFRALRAEIVKNTNTKDPAFKQEILEFFSSASFPSEDKKDKVLTSLMKNITGNATDDDIQEIEQCEKKYLEYMQRNDFYLGGSAIQTVLNLYGGQVEVVDKDFKTLTSFQGNPSSNKMATLRLRNQHYDVVIR